VRAHRGPPSIAGQSCRRRLAAWAAAVAALAGAAAGRGCAGAAARSAASLSTASVEAWTPVKGETFRAIVGWDSVLRLPYASRRIAGRTVEVNVDFVEPAERAAFDPTPRMMVLQVVDAVDDHRPFGGAGDEAVWIAVYRCRVVRRELSEPEAIAAARACAGAGRDALPASTYGTDDGRWVVDFDRGRGPSIEVRTDGGCATHERTDAPGTPGSGVAPPPSP
jgi:hypothetical protein